MTVTISPGVTTGELMEFFLNNEICFESDTIISTVTYGGVLSGGCHVSYNSLLPNDVIWRHDLCELSISLWEFIWCF